MRGERTTRYWGDKLLKVGLHRLQNTKFPEKTKEFFQDIGIPPILHQELFSAIMDEDIPLTRIVNHQQDQFILLGEIEFGSKLYVKEVTGEVYSFNPRNSINFVNSSVEAFVNISTVYREFVDKYDDDELKGQVELMRQEMIAEDPRAFEDEGSWWNNILQDLILYLTELSE